MAKYFATVGIRKNQGALANPALFPFLVIVGPSGQACQVHGPSGYDVASAIPQYTTRLQAYEQSVNHKCLVWRHNELLLSMRNEDATIGHNMIYAWQPYGQQDTGTPKKNTAGFEFETNTNMGHFVMFDGYNWKIAGGRYADSYREHAGFINLADGVFWAFPRNEDLLSYGIYKGHDPIFMQLSAISSGWKPRDYHYGMLNYGPDNGFCLMHDGNTTNVEGVGTDATDVADFSNNFCDMIYFKGTIYIAKQYSVIALTVGGKATYIYNDFSNDDNCNNVAETATYTSRVSQDVNGAKSRCFAVHNNTLYMLQNDGKVFEVYPHGIKQIANLSLLETPWSSGVIGGYCPDQPGTGQDWPGCTPTNGFRCYLASFNNQLHAFLNFASSYRHISGGTGRGIFWATSFNATNWTDQSPNLPSSGIHSPSGITLNDWKTLINPYLFSGKNNAQYPADYVDQSIGTLCQPSGFRQTGILPWWSSGVLLDADNTAYNALQIPLEYGALSGYLFPTLVQYPADWTEPSGVGPSGYDYVGCYNYHIAGHVDKDAKRLRLFFTRDYDDGGTLFYDLTTSSGWIQRNWIPESKQLNGFMPIDLYDPEVIIPSGDLYNPNPYIDEYNKKVYVKYYLYDWGYWDAVDLKVDYSTDNGQNWFQASTVTVVGKSTGIKAKSTGSKQTDPSGVLGAPYTLCWDYSQDLSKHVYYPDIQIRIRAEK